MNCLVVFARAPQPGKVKTRLAEKVGAMAAANLYAAMLRDTLNVAVQAEKENLCHTTICYTPTDAFAPGDSSLAPFWDGAREAQIEGDLGEKMRAVVNACFAQGAARVVLIGSDKPDLTVEILRDAFARLQNADLVFGPAHDGGFYLIGARAPLPATLFSGVPWSSSQTLRCVLENARQLELTFAQLPPGADVDEWDDFAQIDMNNAPHTQRELAKTRL